MRAAFVCFIAGCFILFGISLSEAELFAKKKKQDTVAPAKAEAVKPAQKPEPVKKEAEPKAADQEAIKAKKAQVEKIRKSLNNTEWTIDLSPLSGKTKKEADLIVFAKNQVMSTHYGKKGFPPTNYTVTVGDDGVVTWETMQTSEKSGVIFWRGEIETNMQNMRGILSYRVDDVTTEDYSFVSTARNIIKPEESVTQENIKSEAGAPKATPAPEQKK